MEAAGVRENRPLPLREIMQITVCLDDLGAGTQPQMKGVAENNFRTDGVNISRQHALDRAIGAHRHKGRGLHRTAIKREFTATRFAVGGFKGELHQDSEG